MSRPIPQHTAVPGHPGVTMIDGGAERPTLVSTLGAFSRLDPFETDRYQRLAALQHRRIAIVETPGWTKGTKLDRTAREELRKGHFAGVGRSMGQAVAAVADLDTGSPVSVLGYSMGCSTATAMAHWFAREGVPVCHLTLVEPVAITPRHPSVLFARNSWEGLFSAKHLRENHGLAEIPTPSLASWGDRRRIPEPLHLLWALSRGRLAEQVTALARSAPGLAITLIHGSASRLVSKKDLRRLSAALLGLGVRVQVQTVGGAHHALWHSRPTVDRLAQAIG
ncbi:hypothetical protein [Granulicoccus sp. GXG6511]|uniref:hypothetical protein n=1 Tax=Granulicoccus sp. GXG6511 TaxID=3381351 RepID=UPI003D7D0614